MKLRIAVFLIIAFFAALLYLPAGADNNGSVEIQVTPKIISITVSGGVLDYGPASTGSTDRRPSPAGFDVVNNGTDPVKLQILGSNTTGMNSGSPGWQLGSSPGADTYVHRFSTHPNPADVSEFTVLDTMAQDFLSSLPSGSSTNVKLSLDMPTTTSTTEAQKASVTVIATEAP